MEATYKLVVEGGIKVLYKEVWVTEIPFESEEITIGVMDTDNNIYPDINLRQYRLDGGDPYISRRHGRFIYSDGKYYIEDICRNNSTSIDKKSEIINGVKREISLGTRVFISESVVFRFEANEPKQEIPQVKEAAQETILAKEVPDTNINQNFAPKEKSEEELPIQSLDSVVQDAPKETVPSESLSYYLEIAGASALFFKPANVFTNRIELLPKEWQKDQDGLAALQIGRRSTEDGIYPDIDLWKFYFNDSDEYIARRHARIIEKEGKLYFQDLSGKGSTWFNEKDDEHRLLRTPENQAIAEIQDGSKLIISDSAVFTVHKN